jgi:hypothetical protein
MFLFLLFLLTSFGRRLLLVLFNVGTKNHWAVLSGCRARPAALLLRAGYTSPKLNDTRPWSSHHIRDVSFDPFDPHPTRFSYWERENLFRTAVRARV